MKARRHRVLGRPDPARLLFVTLAIVALSASAWAGVALASPPSNAFRFVHDADGRLKAAIDPEGDTAVYSWDAAGNLESIARQASSKLSIVQITPSRGEAGDTVLIEGTGFSETPGSNVVKFNGKAATVNAATPFSLEVKVPAEASTGAVTVAAGEEGPVSSPGAFTVVESPAPHISSISPTLAVAGEEITVSGSNFESTASSEALTLNRARPEVTSSSSSSIKFKVPTATLGGHVSVTTAMGSSTGPDLFIPPNGTSTSKVGATDRFSLGESRAVEIPTGKVALELFDGVAGERMSMTFSESTFAGGEASVWSPGGTQLAAGSFSGGFIEVSSLPLTGTYTVLLSPSGGSAGSLKLTSYKPSDITGSISPKASAEGTTQHVAIAAPGQNARYSVTISAGEKVSLRTNNSKFSGSYGIRWLNSKGEALYSESWSPEENWFWDSKTFASAGTYTLLVDPSGPATGSVDLQLWETPDLSGQTITPAEEGGSVKSTIEIPGQRELITFSGTEGQQFAWGTSESTISSGGTVTLRQPSGAQLASGGFSEFHEAISLPETGTYTFLVDPATTGFQPAANGTGHVKVTGYLVPEDITGSISPKASAEGTTQHVAIAAPGQNARYSVTISAGEKVSLRTNNSKFSGSYGIRWLNSKGEALYSESWSPEENWFWDSKTFASAGTYTLLVDPSGPATGSVDLQLWETPDLSGQTITPAEEGGSVKSTIEIPGQRELITFSGTEGQQFAWGTSESTISSGGTVTLRQPSGAQLASGGFSEFHEAISLPETGTYTFLVDPATTGFQPAANGTGHVKVTGYLVPEDITGSISPKASAEGTTQHVAIAAPGQNARYSVTISAGEKVSLRTNNSKFSGSYGIRWLNSKGEALYSESWSPEENWFWDSKTFASAGTYTLLVDPSGPATGSVDLQLWETPDLSGQTITPAEEGGSVKSTIEIPGQRELITFSGTASQLVTVKAQESTIASGAMRVLTPEGSQLSGGEASFSSGSSGRVEVTLPSTGTYTIVVDPPSTSYGPVVNGTGSVKVSVYLGSHVAWFGPVQVPGELVNFEIADPPPSPRYSDIPSRPATPALKVRFAAVTPEPTSKAHPKNSRYQGDHVSIQKARTHRLHPRQAAGTSLAQAKKRDDRSYRGVQAGVVTAQMPLAPKPKRAIPESSSTNLPNSAAVNRIEKTFTPSEPSTWRPPRSRRSAGGWFSRANASPWARVPSLSASAGVTALAGQVLEQNGEALAGIKVKVEGSNVRGRTDAAGRFVLAGLPAGHQVLVVDGNSIPGRRFGVYELAVDLLNGKTTRLESTVWLTELDPSGDQRITSPTKHEVTLTYPKIPGLEIKLPAGTVMHNAAGKRVKKLNITAIPLDRAPSPLPAFQPISLYYTIQPGRVTLNKGAQIIYPNWSHAPPGQRVAFWNYNAKDHGWFIYGHGSVTPDGKQIVPDPGVRVWNFSGAMVNGWRELAEEWAKKFAESGDPVDLQSGLFDFSSTDLVLPDTIPITIDRTYRQNDPTSYSFGRGTQSSYDVELWSRNNYHEVDLILPDSARVHYDRISLGTGWADAVYRSSDTPGPFFGSTIRWDAAEPGWDLKLTDGMKFIFGELAPLQAIENAQGERLVLTRESGQTGNITKITSPHGRWVNLEYDGYNRITGIKDNGGGSLKYSYAEGLLTTAKNLSGQPTKYEYDPGGDMTSVTNARGNKFLENEYAPDGRVVKQSTDDGGTFEFEYDLNEAGKAESTTVTDPMGSTKQVWFDSEGRSTTETVGPESEFEQTTTFEYEPKTNLLLSSVDPLKRETTYEYDEDGNVRQVNELAGTEEERVSKFAYDPGTSWTTEEVDPLGHATSYEYGAKGELLSETNPVGDKTAFDYGGDGLLDSVTNPLKETTAFGYTDGDLTSITNPRGGTYIQSVDGLGRTLSVTSPKGERTRYRYDEAGRLTSEISPSGDETDFEYDPDGNLISITDPRGGETTRTYDAMDRLSAEKDPLGRTSEWVYDKAGDVEELIGRDGGVTAFAHDPLRRTAEVSYGVSGEGAESSVQYEYDAANRVTAVKDSPSGEYDFSYNGFDQPTDLTGPNGEVSYSYDPAGRREEMDASGQAPTEYEYSDANQLIGLQRGGESVALAYDKAGRTESITLPNDIEERYGYDPAGNTTSIEYEGSKGPLGEMDYAYDADGLLSAEWGNYARLDLPKALASTEYDADNQLVERDGQPLEYDKEGHLVDDGESQYAWNARGELVEISGEKEASFAYDPFGRRVSKTLGGTTTELLYDEDNVVTESEGGSTSGSVLAGLRPDQIFARTTGEGTDSYLTDALGSTIALAGESAEVQTTYTYDPFGSSVSKGAESDNPFRFVGREDDGTGLIYSRARYYSPGDARFISPDPAGFSGSGSNLYWYASGDPLDFSDPLGEETVAGGPTTVGGSSGGGMSATSKALLGIAWWLAAEEAAKVGSEILEKAGNLPRGKSKKNSRIREGDQETQEEIHREAEEHGKPIQNPPGNIDREWELEDGTRIRERNSDEHGMTTEVEPPGNSRGKIKIHLPR